jgi:hypothetical protein
VICAGSGYRGGPHDRACEVINERSTSHAPDEGGCMTELARSSMSAALVMRPTKEGA